MWCSSLPLSLFSRLSLFNYYSIASPRFAWHCMPALRALWHVDRLGSIVTLLGAILERLARVGIILARFGAIFARLGVILGDLGAILRHLGAYLPCLGAILDRLRTNLTPT